MADVAGADDRAQLLLVTALSMAIMFVALALVLNTAIYTENLATRSSDIGGGSDAIRFRDSVRKGIAGAVEYANAHNDTTHADLRANLTASVGEWTNATGRLSSTRGTGTDASLSTVVDGTRIEQDNGTRDFTNESGSVEDWTLASGVGGTRAFRVNVTDHSALDDFDDDPFTVVVDDGSNVWRMNVSDDGGNTAVGIDAPGPGSSKCSVSEPEPWINVTAGTVAGGECDGLEFADGLSPPYRIEYEDSDDIAGTYRLVVDNSTLANDPDPNFDDDDGTGLPYVAPAIYSADIDVVYRTPRLYYNTTVRVAPGEPK